MSEVKAVLKGKQLSGLSEEINDVFGMSRTEAQQAAQQSHNSEQLDQTGMHKDLGTKCRKCIQRDSCDPGTICK